MELSTLRLKSSFPVSLRDAVVRSHARNRLLASQSSHKTARGHLAHLHLILNRNLADHDRRLGLIHSRGLKTYLLRITYCLRFLEEMLSELLAFKQQVWAS